MTQTDLVGVRQVIDIRRDFPLITNSEAAYLDSAATAQRPSSVLDAERDYLQHRLAPVHRGASMAVGHATSMFEDSRATIARFVGAGDREIVFAENATDALNIVALGIADASGPLGEGASVFALQPGDEIVVTEAEHHANLIPWQRLAVKTGAKLVPVHVDEHGLWQLDALQSVLSKRTRIVAVAEVSNVTGYLAPVADVVAATRKHAPRALVVLDACQSVPHRPTEFSALGVDFAAFSGHKMLGPDGIGVLYGRAELLDVLPPARTGGSTITRVTMEKAEFLPAPQRFEAGTQPVSQVIALAAAVRYLTELDMAAIAEHESALAERAIAQLVELPGVRVLGPALGVERAGIVAVAVDGVHAHDVGQVLDEAGVIVRVGHHCAQPLHRALGISATTRASAHVYTTAEEFDRFTAAISGVRSFFGVAA